jgi:hypothetical protein
MSEKERMHCAGVDMTNWDFSDIEDPKHIYKAFVALCNFAEGISGCAGCPLRDQICFSKNGNGDKFWSRVLSEKKKEG